MSEKIKVRRHLREINNQKMLKISVKRPIGYRISDIGAGGKEYNVKEVGWKSGWKKVSETKWRNTKNNNKFVEIYPYNNSYIIENEKGFNSKGLIGIVKSKIKAQEFAVRYMKSHR